MKILRERKMLRDHGAGRQARDGIRPQAAITRIFSESISYIGIWNANAET